jgi:hypothetical protein
VSDDVTLLRRMARDLSLEYPEKPTLLDRFAGQALAGLMASRKWWGAGMELGKDEPLEHYVARSARMAYAMAQGMLVERARILAAAGGGTPPEEGE